MRHQIDVDGDTIAALENALATLRLAGATGDTEVRVRTRASFHADGAYARSVTARWTDPKPEAATDLRGWGEAPKTA